MKKLFQAGLLSVLLFHGTDGDHVRGDTLDEGKGTGSSSVSQAAVPGPAPVSPLPDALAKLQPRTIEDLRLMEQYVSTLITRVSPAVVGIQVGSGSGSGVVISQDGLVLTAAHVCDEPRRPVRFRFPDGTTARGETLGVDHDTDAGLMRITDPGDWPFVEMGPKSRPAPGNWVLALGHPGGFDPARSPVVRLGRVLRASANRIQSECPLTGGDSGGPLFDMHGRVAGIHSRISEAAHDNYHVPITAYHQSWERLLKGEAWGRTDSAGRSWVGIQGSDLAEGVEVQAVEKESPAFAAGVKPGDVILQVNDRPVRDFAAFRRMVLRSRPGDRLNLDIRRDGEDQRLAITVAARSSRS